MMLDELNGYPASRSALPQARISEVAKPVAARDSAFAAEHGLPASDHGTARLEPTPGGTLG